MRCLRRIAHVKWQDKKPNTEVLELCNITGIEALLIKAQFQWTGHVIRMDNNRMPKTIFFSELANGARSCGGQRKRYKDSLKDNISDPTWLRTTLNLWRWTEPNGVQAVGIQSYSLKRIVFCHSEQSGRPEQAKTLGTSHVTSVGVYADPGSQTLNFSVTRDPSSRRLSPSTPDIVNHGYILNIYNQYMLLSSHHQFRCFILPSD